MGFEASFSGSYPNRCSGKWTLTYDGLPVVIPSDHVHCEKGTRGTYSSWHFEDWMEVFEDYEDGLTCDEWIAANKGWVDEMFSQHNIEISYKNYSDLYTAFQSDDWRHGSCGGCI